jgi:hypothetical protein
VRTKQLNISYSNGNHCLALFPFHPELSASASWDAASASSWRPASTQQPNGPTQWDDCSIQPRWDDFISRCDRWFHPPRVYSANKIPAAFIAFSQRRLDPFPLVRVQEIYLMAATGKTRAATTSLACTTCSPISRGNLNYL